MESRAIIDDSKHIWGRSESGGRDKRGTSFLLDVETQYVSV